MKKGWVLCIALLLFCVFGTAMAEVTIDENVFPDEAFRQFVSDEFDTDKNGTLSAEEILAVTSIDCKNKGISNVTGCEIFTELTYLDCAINNITAEACVGHLYFTQLDHERLGAKIKVNPAIKTPVDQFMLREALTDGRISVVGTDHAPHLLSQKEGGCVKAASGMPMIQFSLVTMLELVDEGVLTIQRLVDLMCHNPARLFGVQQRGFLRKGYRADIVIVRPKRSWTVTKECVLSKCGWSPLEGHTFNWQVERTLCNGHTVYHNGQVDNTYIGEEIAFSHS